MIDERLLLILKARQLGISWLTCAYALWLCLYHPGKVVLAFSKGQEEANELTRRITVMYERLPEPIRATLPALAKANTEEIAWANGSRVKSMPATPGAGRTFTASLAIMDEAAFMNYADKLYTSLKPTIDVWGNSRFASCRGMCGPVVMLHGTPRPKPTPWTAR
jgi:phage FluMu gp28-like protein